MGERGAVLRDRLRRVVLLNRVLAPTRLTVSEWEETAYVLRSPTGHVELVPDLTSLWAAVQRMRGTALDPLDPALLESFAR